MALSNADLAQKISDLIDFWSQLTVEYKNWLGGAIGGGPNSDGRYPLTDFTGTETLVESPAQLSDDVGGFVDLAQTAETNAAASATASATSAATATTQAGLADAARILAETARTGAETAESSAINEAVTAVAQANLATARAGYAEEWANLPHQTLVSAAAGGDQVDDFSALHWATVAEAFAGSIDSNLYGQLAQNEEVTGIWRFQDNIRVLTDIVTATPPTNEAVVGEYSIYDLDNTDKLARFGYIGAGAEAILYLTNFMRSGHFRITGRASGGTERLFLIADPDGLTTLIAQTDLYLQATGAVSIRDGADFRIYDSTNIDNAAFSHDGVDFNTDFINTTDWNITGLQDFFLSGIRFKIADIANANVLQIASSSTAHTFTSLGGIGTIRWDDVGLFDLRDGAVFRIRDSGDTDFADFSHDGIDFNTDFTNTTDWNITGLTVFELKAGADFRVWDNSDTDWFQIHHSGTFAEFSAINTSAIRLLGGLPLRFLDTSNADSATFSHDGVDFNTEFVNTIDWNLLGGVDFKIHNAALTGNFRIICSDTPQVVMDSVNGPLVIRTTSSNKDILFYAGGGAETSEILRLSADDGVSVRNGKFLRLNDSLDTDWAEFSHDGIDFNTDFVNTTDWNIFDVTVKPNYTIADGSSAALNTLRADLILNGTTAQTGILTTLAAYMTNNNSAAVTNIRALLASASDFSGASSGNVAILTSLYADTVAANSLTNNQINAAYGLFSQIRTANAKGRIAQARGIYSVIKSQASGRIDNGYAFYGAAPVTLGTYTNNYGLYLEDQTGAASLNYAIFTNAGLVHFGDVVEVTGAITASNLNVSDWDTAFGWGNHASGGYAPSAHSHTSSEISALDAGDTTTGAFADARIPNLAAGKITSGTFVDGRIPDLNTAKIISGTFVDARIPNLDASKITAGTLLVGRGGTGQTSIAALAGVLDNEAFDFTNSAAPLRSALGIPYYVTATYVGGKISVQSTAPSSPAKGDIWFDTT